MSTDAVDSLFRELVENNGKENGIELGHNYIVEDPEQARKIYSGLVSNGTRGLCISRMHPNHLKEYGIKDSEWIASENGYRDPKKPETLTNYITSFMKENNGSCVLLEGLEYLMINNDFNTVIKMVEEISQYPSSTLILAIDPRCFDDKELALLERHREIIEK